MKAKLVSGTLQGLHMAVVSDRAQKSGEKRTTLCDKIEGGTLKTVNSKAELPPLNDTEENTAAP